MPEYNYATDGKCHNTEPGTFGHEGGQPAEWVGTDKRGLAAGFCNHCKHRGAEACGVVQWQAREPINKR